MLPLYRSGDSDVVSTAGRGYAGTVSFNDEAVNKNTNAKQAVYSGEAPLVYVANTTVIQLRLGRR